MRLMQGSLLAASLVGQSGASEVLNARDHDAAMAQIHDCRDTVLSTLGRIAKKNEHLKPKGVDGPTNYTKGRKFELGGHSLTVIELSNGLHAIVEGRTVYITGHIEQHRQALSQLEKADRDGVCEQEGQASQPQTPFGGA